jgi:hypothetical protein
MKAYQVFSGEISKHGHQRYDLVETYLSKDKAFQRCKQIAEDVELYGDVLEEDEWNGKCKGWYAVGWDRVEIAKVEEIEIVE